MRWDVPGYELSKIMGECVGRRVYDCGSMTYGPGDDPRHPSTGIEINNDPRPKWGDDSDDDNDWRMIMMMITIGYKYLVCCLL